MADLMGLSLVKSHVRSERDDENDYLQHLVDAAVSRFETFTGRTLYPADTDPDSLGESDVLLYMDILHGLLLLIGQWYEYRENAVEKALSEMPQATARLWEPYILYHLGDTDDHHETAD